MVKVTLSLLCWSERVKGGRPFVHPDNQYAGWYCHIHWFVRPDDNQCKLCVLAAHCIISVCFWVQYV